MLMNVRTPGMLAGAFVLAACGGGDGGPPAPDAASFDTIVIGDVLLAAQDRLYRAQSSCSGSVCTVTYLGESVTVDLDNVDPSASTTDGERPAGAQRGADRQAHGQRR